MVPVTVVPMGSGVSSTELTIFSMHGRPCTSDLGLSKVDLSLQDLGLSTVDWSLQNLGLSMVDWSLWPRCSLS
ncbi:hypothetical protein EYF80_055676 [Liparis tanakae]|uniref:Uncharacterized protein n=1 Tax=Liparis tanakae TaxID=230148 RepID=A0A4Z2EZF9_9TELE|nr:hypothetical protein EYF80_055676 [Liparis tanakae]